MTVQQELIVRREDGGLAPREANFVPLSPLDFLSRAGDVYPEKVAVVSGNRAITYRAFRDRAARLAGALRTHGIGAGGAGPMDVGGRPLLHAWAVAMHADHASLDNGL